MYTVESVPLSKLVLNQDNPRFPEPQENQRAAINTMLKLQQDKLVQLATDICERGLDPTERVLVVSSTEYDGRYKVLEGNRRITALKVLQECGLVDDEKQRAVFSRLAKTSSIIPTVVDCAIIQEEAESEHWVSLKHTGQNSGKGRVEWQTTEKERFRASLGDESYSNQFYTYLINEDMFDDLKEQIKRLIKPTNLGRLLGDPFVRKCLNLEPINGTLFCSISKNQFFDKCYVLVNEMLGKGKIDEFKVKHIFYKEDRADLMSDLKIHEIYTNLRKKPWKINEPQNYQEEEIEAKVLNADLTNAPELTQKNQDLKPNAPETEPKNDGQQPNGEKRTRPENTERNRLISQHYTLKIESQKCNEIFKELKNKLTPIDNYKYSISVMIRIFIDLSVSFYINKRIPKDRKASCRGLHEKICFVCNYMKEIGDLTPSEATSVQTFSSAMTGPTGDLQQYVHNEHFHPEKSKLIAEWDNFKPLLQAIWK